MIENDLATYLTMCQMPCYGYGIYLIHYSRALLASGLALVLLLSRYQVAHLVHVAHHAKLPHQLHNMHFRQRVAWLMLAGYLLLTAAGLYYLFEINEQFSLFALEHSNSENSQDMNDMLRHPHEKNRVIPQNEQAVVNSDTESRMYRISRAAWSLASFVSNLPVPVVGLLLVAAYLQVFCMLWMGTRPEAQCFTTCLWPIVLYSSLSSSHSFPWSFRTRRQMFVALSDDRISIHHL